jgi:hypothetical protein
MKEGWWINYQTLKCFVIDEHEMFIRRGNNAYLLGVPKTVRDKFDEYRVTVDRDEFIEFIVLHSPLMRIRGHGSYATFEYGSAQTDIRPSKAVKAWGEIYAGPMLLLNIVNLRTNTNVSEIWSDFRCRFPSIPLILG